MICVVINSETKEQPAAIIQQPAARSQEPAASCKQPAAHSQQQTAEPWQLCLQPLSYTNAQKAQKIQMGFPELLAWPSAMREAIEIRRIHYGRLACLLMILGSS